MSATHTQAKARRCSIRAVVTRADGTVEDLGLISFSHRNLFIHYAVNAYIRLKELICLSKFKTRA
jgi:hypothetical protein